MTRRRSYTKGFTMVELLLAGFLGFVVVTAIYLVFIGTTRQYSVQEEVVTMHESMRFAVDFLKSELKGAGRLTVVNGREKAGQDDALGIRDPMFCPEREGIQAFQLFEGDANVPTILSSVPNELNPDRLQLMKDAPGAVPLKIRRIEGPIVYLSLPELQLTQAAQQFAQSRARLERAFAVGHYLFVMSRTGLSDLLPITDFSFQGSGTAITLAEVPCDLGGRSLITQCAFGGCLAAPVQLVEYRVELEADSSTSTVLMRKIKDAREPLEDLTSEGLVLASEIIDFQVMGLLDLRSAAQIQVPGSQPQITPDNDPRDDRGNTATESEAAAINSRPEKIRSVRVVLAARTKREDPQFTLAIDKTTAGELRQPTERTWFELDKRQDSGYARVTTLSFEVETPNLFRGN